MLAAPLHWKRHSEKKAQQHGGEERELDVAKETWEMAGRWVEEEDYRLGTGCMKGARRQELLLYPFVVAPSAVSVVSQILSWRHMDCLFVERLEA